MTFVNHFKEKMISCKNETSNAEAEVEAAGFVMRLEISKWEVGVDAIWCDVTCC